jgi:hypothetical protein
MTEPARTETDRTAPSRLKTLESGVLTSIPVLSVLVFIVVTLKVFRVSGMETTTTVTVISEADTFALLRGVVVTLLPGFLEALTAVSLWLWASRLPRRADGAQANARAALLSPEAAAAWILTVTMFFTIAWPIFLLIFVPMVLATGALYWAAGLPRWPSWLRLPRGQQRTAGRWVARLRTWLLVIALVVGTVSLGLLTLQSNPWLPLHAVRVASSDPLTLDNEPLPDEFPAYVLNSDDKRLTLLLDQPRAVVEVERRKLEPDMPLCVPHETNRKWKIRASQVVGIDADVPSPYEECPDPTP